MQFEQAFNGATRIFLDTAPVIYYIERNTSYFTIVQPVFRGIQNHTFQAVTSPITLAEYLILPTLLHRFTTSGNMGSRAGTVSTGRV